MAKLICETEGCGESISEGCGSNGGLPICRKCRGVQYYWRKQGANAFAERREKLDFWVGRMDYLSTHVAKLIRDAKSRVSAARAHGANRLHH